MARILAIDYGTKRVGVAVTDPLQIIATGLTTVHAKDIISFLKNYLAKESVECFVVGEPKNLNNLPSQMDKHVNHFIKELKKNFPAIPVERMDERYTSKMAYRTMIGSGIKKKERKENKGLIDEISAVIILQSYMEKKQHQP